VISRDDAAVFAAEEGWIEASNASLDHLPPRKYETSVTSRGTMLAWQCNYCDWAHECWGKDILKPVGTVDKPKYELVGTPKDEPARRRLDLPENPFEEKGDPLPETLTKHFRF